MDNYASLDKRYSTTKRLIRHSGEKPVSKKDEGGLRYQGYVKRSTQEFPLLSVIILGNGDGIEMEKTILSVLDQTYDNIELIIIGETHENGIDLAANFDDKVDYWIKCSGGQSLSIPEKMNLGLEAASGLWLNFLNAGDYIFENETVQNVLSTFYGNSQFIYGNTYYSGFEQVGLVNAMGFNLLWKTMIFSRQSLYIRSSVMKNRKFNPRYKLCADYELIVDTYMNGSDFFNSGILMTSVVRKSSEVNCIRLIFEKWKIIKKYRNDFEFHQYYLLIFIRYFFQCIQKRLPFGKKNVNH